MAEPQIYRYPLHDTAGIIRRDKALDHLREPSVWRVALPLYRRLRFGRFESGHLFSSIDLKAGSHVPQDRPWFYAFVDRSCRPETEVWFFGSWEAEQNHDEDGNLIATGDSSPPAEPWNTAQAKAAQDDVMRALVIAIKDLSVPTSIHQDVLDAKAKQLEASSVEKESHSGLDRDDYAAHMLNLDVMLWGAVHERTVPVLQRSGLLAEDFKATLVPNYTFIFETDNLPPPRDLLAGLKWGPVKPEHFSLVRSRTQIPRQDRTLAILPSLAIYAEGKTEPIAWTFVGLDSSLTTLHVEPEWRRRGLAQTLTIKLLNEKMRRFYEEGQDKLGLGFVVNGNEASARMCRSLGAKSDWKAYWLRVDLATAQKPLLPMMQDTPFLNGHSSEDAPTHKRKRSSSGEAGPSRAPSPPKPIQRQIGPYGLPRVSQDPDTFKTATDAYEKASGIDVDDIEQRLINNATDAYKHELEIECRSDDYEVDSDGNRIDREGNEANSDGEPIDDGRYPNTDPYSNPRLWGKHNDSFDEDG